MKKYAVVSGADLRAVVRGVEKHLNEGWELAGGIQVTVLPMGLVQQQLMPVFAQALVREEKVEIP